MSIHKLTAGSGYDYLTRQVAAQDATEKGHASLASYYGENGESPGMWVGSGMAGLEGLAADDIVTAEQMRNLFGTGKHPLAEELRAAAAEEGASAREQERVAALGTPYKVFTNDASPFRIEVAIRVAALNKALGQPADAPVSVEDRARIRTQVGTELFQAEYGRTPADARELAASIAKHSRPRTNAVAGYDLTFSPVKSVSALWAIADLPTAAVIERAHCAAVTDALTFLEQHALFTREGTNGVRQVETRGLIGAAFVHRDSRAGDPDLHTHVAVANKVQTLTGGRWLAIDGRLLFKAAVAASERYNTALEHHLRDALGLRFEERPNPDVRKRPVREVVGVDPQLNTRWSTRRANIEDRRSQLASQFQATHGRPPSPVESIQLAQQATLETRESKHEPRSLAEQRVTWVAEAADVLGDAGAVRAMAAIALHPPHSPTPSQAVTGEWVRITAESIRNTVQQSRSHWQRWHVEAEALRRVRTAQVTTQSVDAVVAALVAEVLTGQSIPLTRPGDEVEVPEELRRSDGASVYTVASSQLFTSRDVLAAEQRIVAAAGKIDGMTVTGNSVDLALLESTANGVTLNAGQATMVRTMATSGARVQLAIAPAGSGKTTAMRALTAAWIEAGGNVVGFAPSAVAATVLGESIEAPTDTIAKLVWHLQHPEQGALPEWVDQVGQRTLAIVDEAGMADTTSLDVFIEFVTSRGGSVRLIGDDQQLAAVGAGGVLRDIQATHGALHLTELMRFADPAEGAASLALRDGLPESLGFYLDRDRVHVGDLATLTDDVFAAWCQDRAKGSDAIMLAPTRDLVVELNLRAQTHRISAIPNSSDSSTTELADGSMARTGDVIVTRANNRLLRVTPTDWVKNGDRWTIVDIDDAGAVVAQHTKSGRYVTLPTHYVSTAVELGYATTIHTAQGVTADTSHTLLTGEESRQLAYTAATRGRHANHLYLQVVGDGNEHNVVRPDHVHPVTATDLLERMLAQDHSARSATTIRRDADDPAVLLGEATARYVDSVHVAAEHVLGPEQVNRIDDQADDVVPDLTTCPAWPTLRAHLLLVASGGPDPLDVLREAAQREELDTAADPAAVLLWRLDDASPHGSGPLPWLPGIPPGLAEDTKWGPYLAARAARVREHATTVHTEIATSTVTPAWAQHGRGRPSDQLLADVAVWRAAMQVDPSDRRPTGPTCLAIGAARHQQTLNARLASNRTPAWDEWAPTLQRLLTAPTKDPFTPVLAERLATLSRVRLDVAAILRTAIAAGPLPDDHNAAALWWRIAGHLSPAVAAQAEADHALTTAWTPRLGKLVGDAQAQALQTSSWWPALVTVVDHAIARGHAVEDLLARCQDVDDMDLDACQALVWRLSVLNDAPSPAEDREAEPWSQEPPEDLEESNPFWDSDSPVLTTPADREWADLTPLEDAEPVNDGTLSDEDSATEPVLHADHAGATRNPLIEELLREFAGPLPLTDRELDAQLAWAYEADTAQVSPERIAELNQLAREFYIDRFSGSWAQSYLAERMLVDLAGDPHVQPGYAPAGWTSLVSHLRRRGATDLELTESGLATTASTGRIIDRFRDRIVFPINRIGLHGQVETLGFVGRRHPDQDGPKAGPKYLNTGQTVLFHKGAQLYTIRHDFLAAGATPVLVEGPMDALAVTIATNGMYVGMAPLGTALTEEQARELAMISYQSRVSPIIATDADPAGEKAAERAYNLLAQHGIDPKGVTMSTGTDPAALLAKCGTQTIQAMLRDLHNLTATPLASRSGDGERTEPPAKTSLDMASPSRLPR